MQELTSLILMKQPDKREIDAFLFLWCHSHSAALDVIKQFLGECGPVLLAA